MNVKKYRAATTREALEMIKQDLGEDAFVLETRQVRAGGVLGFGSSMQIEVSAAAPAAEPTVKNQVNAAFPSHQLLNLTDDAPAVPQLSKQENGDRKETLMSALSARAASSNEFERDVSTNFLGAEQSKIEPVEINSEVPRFVHRTKKTAKQISPEPNTHAASAPEDAPAAISSREFEILRAEMREVKFSLGAFTNRHNAQSRHSDAGSNNSGEIFEPPFSNVYDELTATGIPSAIARKFIADAMPHYENNPTDINQLSQTTLLRAVSSLIKFEPDILQRDEPVIMAIIGATGVGKTTTVAKLAARVALYQQRRVELVTLDTYRIAAVEQLKTYALIIGAGCHVARSVFELNAILRRLPSDATVLIDTTGRSPHDLADQYELSDYLQQRTEIRKCLAVQATTHPADASAAIKKFEMYGADCLALTKMDETMRPGAVIETIAESNLPLAYFCTGQRVPEDLQAATAETFTNRILGIKT